MMLSPDAVVEYELKGKSKERVLAWIRGARRRMLEMKREALRRDFDEEEVMFPSLQVRIDVQRDYIKEAKVYYEKIGGKYVMNANEQKAADFENAIEHIIELSVEFTGHDNGERRTFTKEGDKVRVVRDELAFNKMAEFEEDIYNEWSWDDVLEVIRCCYLSEWKRKYISHEVLVLDGDYWKVEVKYDNGLKKCKFEGSNCYPYNFKHFLELLEWNI